MNFLDEYFMKQALKEAIYAYEANEIPVGAILVLHKNIIAKSHNLTKLLKDVTTHAEIQVIGEAESYLKGKHLKECSLYVTLEPCIMCAGAIFWAKLGRLVFGATNSKRGFSNTRISLHRKTIIKNGILSKESSLLLQRFFNTKRKFIHDTY